MKLKPHGKEGAGVMIDGSGRGVLRSQRLPIVAGLVALACATALASVLLSVPNLFIFDSVLLASMGAIALTVLMGTIGEVSIGNSAFLIVGSFSSVWALRAGMPFPLDIVFATLVSAVVGVVVGLPGVRLRGLELALATLAAFFIFEFLANLYQAQDPATQGGFTIDTLFASHDLQSAEQLWALLLFVLLALVILGARQITRARSGRAMRMIRDHEALASAMGIPVLRYKLEVFAAASAVIGLQGALTAHFVGIISTDTFTLTLAIQYVAMVVIGGLGSIAGAVLGAAVVIALPTIMSSVLVPLLGAQRAATQGAQIGSAVYFVLLLVVIAGGAGLSTLLRRGAGSLIGRRPAGGRRVGAPETPGSLQSP